jgi:hypothetical protein
MIIKAHTISHPQLLFIYKDKKKIRFKVFVSLPIRSAHSHMCVAEKGAKVCMHFNAHLLSDDNKAQSQIGWNCITIQWSDARLRIRTKRQQGLLVGIAHQTND